MSADPAFEETEDLQRPAVVLLHGWPTSSHLWRDLVPLVSPWMRVIAPDLADPCDLAGSATSVRATLDDLSIERFAVVGHAEGAAVAQILAVGGGVDAMVLIDAVALDVIPGSAGDAEGSLRTSVRHEDRLTEDTIAEYLKAGPPSTRSVRGADAGRRGARTARDPDARPVGRGRRVPAGRARRAPGRRAAEGVRRRPPRMRTPGDSRTHPRRCSRSCSSTCARCTCTHSTRTRRAR